MTPCPHERPHKGLPCPYRCHAGTTAAQLLVNGVLWDKLANGAARTWHTRAPSAPGTDPIVGWYVY